MASFWEAFSSKRFICCTLIVLYSIDSTVGQSIASISNLGGIFTLGLIYWLLTSLSYYIYYLATIIYVQIVYAPLTHNLPARACTYVHAQTCSLAPTPSLFLTRTRGGIHNGSAIICSRSHNGCAIIDDNCNIVTVTVTHVTRSMVTMTSHHMCGAGRSPCIEWWKTAG